MLQQPREQVHLRILFLDQAMTQLVRSASARSDRIVSTNNECAPLNEWMNPPSLIVVQRRACTAPLTFSASS